MHCMTNYYKHDHYSDFSSHGKYSINMVFGSKHAAIMNELHAHIMCDVFDMHYNSSYSSI